MLVPLGNMARKLREETAGGVYHVYARGNRKEAIFLDDEDRRTYLAKLGLVVREQGWRCLSYALMANHVHHLIELTKPNLAAGMRRLHGDYALKFNRRHDTGGGHLFQQRYGATVAKSDGAAMYFACYVALNPVRAGLCERPEDFAWSSYAATVGREPRPQWLDARRLLSLFGAPDAEGPKRFVDIVDAVRLMGAAGFEPATSRV